jgi:hypothetical protein
MIVSDKNVTDALTYLADDPHPIARARKALTDAEGRSKQTFARIFLCESGSVDARKAAAEVHTAYQEAKAEEAEAVLEFERHKSRVRAAEMIIEIWRSENANARAAERVR